MPSYELIVYGCQMNAYDAEQLAAVMEAAGYVAAEGDGVDVTLVYTCAVRQSATDRALGRIQSLAARKRARPDAVIGVGGCWPAVEAPVIRERCRHVDFTFGTANLAGVPSLVAAARGRPPTDVPADLPPRRRSWPRANVTVTTGCDNYCAYCIVPYARGPERSRPAAAVLAEVSALVAAGFKDITLIGQNVNSYRDGDVTFAELLARADAACDGAVLRFTTNHPRDFGDDVIAAMAAGRNVARHLHLPLQSGSDRVLAAMNRRYAAGYYMDLLARARRALPGLCVTTDLLVGFPGETEKDFEETAAAVTAARFDSAYTFIYSPRPGTAAARLADDVPRPEKIRRLQDLVVRQKEISLARNREFVGQIKTALVEGRSAKDAAAYACRLSENKIANVAAPYRLGDWVRVRLTDASAWAFRGEPAP